ncbi:MAG TPA: hypothetical protein VGJ00_05600 [Rhabdochlamydiaceae bacterium]
MKKKIAFLFLFFTLSCAAMDKAVTYEIQGGRLGDQLIAYMHAKWIAYRYHITLLYKPFQYSNEFVLDAVEELYRGDKPYERVVRIENIGTVEENTELKTLFITQYFPESSYDSKLAKWPSYYIDWDDRDFIAELRYCIFPKNPVSYPPLPEDRVSIALHIRRGGGFDDPLAYLHWPLKFPPDAFYIEQIREIHSLVHTPLYIYIFTDDPQPELIAEKYRAALSDIDAVFDFRLAGNSHKTHVIEDLFDMMRYTCLIRADSNFSIVAEKLGSFQIIIQPTQCSIHKKEIIITQTDTRIRGKF